jgi:hypothetical protein
MRNRCSPNESFEWVTAHGVFHGFAALWNDHELTEDQASHVVERIVKQARALRN